MSDNFAKLSSDALSQASNSFLQLADQRLTTQTERNTGELESKKAVIDKQLENMSSELQKVTGLVRELESDRTEKFGRLSSELGSLEKQILTLNQSTVSLQKALADNRLRGQWGERIAEDILKLMGLMPDVHYRKQETIQGSDGKSRPDFTFLLPNDLKLNMDVKFPFDNYFAYIKCESDADRNTYRIQFLRDVRSKIKEISSRDYIDLSQNTVDCVLMFIPNEQIYRFVHEEDGELLEDALRQKVVLCSPLTLFVVLAVIRQAVQNFVIERSAHEILDILTSFERQWDMFQEQFSDVSDKIEKLRTSYDDLTGKRRRQLDRQVQRIRQLKHQLPDNGIEVLPESLSDTVDEPVH